MHTIDHPPPPNPTAPFLHFPHGPHRTTSRPLLLITITITILISLSVTFLLLLHRGPSHHHPPSPLFLISFDGFRFGFHHKPLSLPNLSRLLSNGTSADLGLIPVFPTLTFPNHYSIATGLFPVHHGIIANSFHLTPTKPFSSHTHSPEFWLGQPIWETLTNANISSAVYFWPGSEVLHNTSS